MFEPPYMTSYGSRKYKGMQHWEYVWDDGMGRTFKSRVGPWANSPQDIIARFELGKMTGKVPIMARIIDIKKVND